MKKVIKLCIMLFFVVFAMLCTKNISYAAGVNGTTIVLNPGHGGSWTGCANGSKGLVEKDLTLKIAKYLETELKKYYNVKVILTHDGVNFPKDDAGDLAARAMVARDNNAELYVSVHIDDAVDKSWNGATVYTTSRIELPKYKEGMTKLGNKILANLSKLGIKSNGVVNNKLCNDKEPKYQYYDHSQADYYGDIRHCMKGDTEDYGPDFSDGSGIPAVLVEHCYMNNSHDVQFLDSEQDLQNLAKADSDAIADYLGLKLPSEVITEITIDRDNFNLQKGATAKLTATTKPVIGNVTWKSSDKEVATIDENGKVTALKEGTTTITATAVDNTKITKSITIKVMNIDVPENTKMSFKNYTINETEKFISKIGPNVKIEDFEKNLDITDNIKVEVKPANKNQEVIGTNTKVIFYEKDTDVELKEYECLVYGDINGDGEINSYDMYLLRAHMINTIKLTNNELTVANTSKDSNKEIDSYDMYLLRAEMINLSKINQE